MLLKDFYTISGSEKVDDENITRLRINKNHAVYEGHFPNRPVTPGVILMQLFQEEAERLSKCKLRLIRSENIKFIAVVDPNEEEEFVLHSKIEREGENLKLRGEGKHKNSTAIKINAVYKVINPTAAN